MTTTPAPVILFPDFRGAATSGGFAEHIACAMPASPVVAILNGPDSRRLATVARTAPCDTVTSTDSGLAAALAVGYRHVLDVHPGRGVVRVDTAEHPIEAAAPLWEEASAAGAAVGDLRFSSETLRAGSADELAQLGVFPTLFRSVTGGRLALSGAHGMQSFTAAVLADVLPRAARLHAAAANGRDEAFPWAFDAAMALAAVEVGVVPTVLAVDAVAVRDRRWGKIARQFDAVSSVCLAFHDGQAARNHRSIATLGRVAPVSLAP